MEDIFCWWYSACKHLRWEAVDCITREGPKVPSAGFVCEKENLVKFLKLALPVRFLVSLLCRLGPVCKTRTLNNQESILAHWRRASRSTPPIQNIYETQTDSSNIGLLKQAESRAKIISKVIRQSNPDSLTQTTVSANTDRAAMCSEGNTDFICREELEDSGKWQQM